MVVTYSINIRIKKRSTVLAFHCEREAITLGAVEIQQISGDFNWVDLLTKVVNNCKFIACTKVLMVLYVKSKIL